MAFAETLAAPLAVILAATFAAAHVAALAAEPAAARAAPVAEVAAEHAAALAEVAADAVTLVLPRAGRAGICSIWKNLKSGRKDAPKILPSLSQRTAN